MIDIKKKYKTREGKEVRIYATDHASSFGLSIIGAVKQDTDWWCASWTPEGSYGNKEYESHNDLIEVKPRIQRTVWLNFYPESFVCFHKTREVADLNALSDRLACVKVEIDCEEGEGLDD